MIIYVYVYVYMNNLITHLIISFFKYITRYNINFPQKIPTLL